jgi:1,4-dihydroxy-2-naphthoyl-CoA hydrolase
MAIWFKPFSIDEIENLEREDHMGFFLGIKFTRVGDDEIEARMPVDNRTKQPYGILHGGASVVLAETIGSFASHYVIDNSKYQAVGMEVNANHLRPVRDGFVTAVCKPIHLGKSSHVWDIRISDDKGKTVCISRLTVAIIHRQIKNPE